MNAQQKSLLFECWMLFSKKRKILVQNKFLKHSPFNTWDSDYQLIHRAIHNGSPIDFCSCWAAKKFKEPWNLFPCPKYIWAFNFLGIIETCCSDRDFWFHRHLQILLQQKSLTPTVCNYQYSFSKMINKLLLRG
jgi:hypothetical protein